MRSGGSFWTMTSIRLLFFAAFVMIEAPAALEAQGGSPAEASGIQIVTLTHQGRVRQYLLHVPAAPAGAVVLAFHGGGQRAEQMRQISRFDALADREHFIVAYPDAFERSWADGRNETSAEKQGIDDVAFAKAVVADIARMHAIDRGRVFATGLSNGGILAHRIACEAADTFAAVAPVISAIASTIAASCRPSAPVGILSIQGVADPAVHFEGGYVGDRPGTVKLLGSRATEQLWSSLNGCAPTVTSTPLPVLVQDGTSITRRTYTGCRANADVVWYEIEGGGHRWPPPHSGEGVSEAAAERENGASSRNISASEVIWDFFAAHGRR
jgi:polyhydroxybutyrate depolymerase